MERVTGIEIIERRLDSLAVERIVADAGKVDKAVDLSKVKGDSNQDTAVLAVIAFKPTKVKINDKEYISIYLCDLRGAQTTARLLVDRTVFGVIMSAVKPPASVEGLLILVVRPAVSIDTNNGGQLTFNLEYQNQIAVVGRCKYFARCGATKRNVGPDGMETFCKIPIDSSLCVHCSYHAKTEQPKVGEKRSLPMDPLAAVENKVTNYMFKSTNRATSSILNKDRDGALNEEDEGDVAFALRHNTAAVNSLLGAAYNTSSSGSDGHSANSVLNRADPIELRTAQKIIQSLSTSNTNTTSTTAALPMQRGGGRVPQRVVSALSQRGERITQARSGNQHTIATATAANNNSSNINVSSNNSYSVPPNQAAMAANSSTRNAYLLSQQRNTTSTHITTNPTNTYKLVGDTIINANNLARNVANIAPVKALVDTSTVGVFHQLLSTSNNSDKTNTQSTQVAPSVKSNPVPYQHTVYSQNTTTNTASKPNTTRTTSTTTQPTQRVQPTTTKSTTTATTATTVKSALESEIDQLLGRSSSHAAEADADWAEGFDKRMDVLAKREYAQTKAAEVQSIDVSAFKCLQCEGRLTQEFPSLCHQNLHTVVKVAAVKRFFECGQCGKREHSLSARSRDQATKVILPPEIRCLTCGAFRWRPCGARGSGPLSVSVRDNMDGEKKHQSVEGGRLILSASEWTKRGDSVSMAERVSTLK